MKTSTTDRAWRWQFCDLESDSVALLRCSTPRPFKLGATYALRDGGALYVALQPRQPYGLDLPDVWVITDWVLERLTGQTDHAADMLVDAIARTRGYWNETPAGGMMIYLPAKFGAWRTAAGLAEAGFIRLDDHVQPDGVTPWHLPAEVMPQPHRGATTRGRVRSSARFTRGARG